MIKYKTRPGGRNDEKVVRTVRKQTRAVAVCGMMAALSVVLMVLGAILEIGLYAAPMLAGLCLLPVGERYGKKYQLILWAAVSALCLILVRSPEQNLMYLCVFGYYPVLRPALQKLPRGLRFLTKTVWFNGVTVLVELLVIKVLAPEALAPWMAVALLAAGNAVFWCYDFVLPMAQFKLTRALDKVIK